MSASSDFVPLAPEAEALPRRSDVPGTKLDVLVLACDAAQVSGVDLASGALVRAWSPAPVEVELRPYDVVAAILDDTVDLLPDPTQPESVPLAQPPEPIGRLTGRRVERYLRELVHPPNQPLLAIHGSGVPFWQRTADYPSIAVVEPEGPAVIRLRDGAMWCLFGWRGVPTELPCLDRRLARMLGAAGRTRIDSARGERLLVALAPPIEGHCHKVVSALLPRP